MAKNRREAKRIREQISKNRIRPEKRGDKPERKRGKGNKARGRQKKVTIEELQEEYSYVLKDLRRIFVLAGIMFVLLIAANLLFPILFG